jgi:hypothetical protein
MIFFDLKFRPERRHLVTQLSKLPYTPIKAAIGDLFLLVTFDLRRFKICRPGAASAASELRLRSFYAADAEFPYQINVILWALDRARTLDFSSTKALRTLPSWISH